MAVSVLTRQVASLLFGSFPKMVRYCSHEKIKIFMWNGGAIRGNCGGDANGVP